MLIRLFAFQLHLNLSEGFCLLWIGSWECAPGRQGGQGLASKGEGVTAVYSSAPRFPQSKERCLHVPFRPSPASITMNNSPHSLLQLQDQEFCIIGVPTLWSPSLSQRQTPWAAAGAAGWGEWGRVQGWVLSPCCHWDLPLKSWLSATRERRKWGDTRSTVLGTHLHNPFA